MSNTLPKDRQHLMELFNKNARKCSPPYDVPMDKEGPHISEENGKVVVSDGWITFYPANDDTPEEALEKFRKRGMCIQRRQIMRRVITKDDFRNLFKEAEEAERKAEREATVKHWT